MGFVIHSDGRGATVYLSGDIDEHAATVMRADMDTKLSAVNRGTVILDFSGVTFVDSTGLGLILGRYKKLKSRGIETCIGEVTPIVDKIFKASGVYSVCPKIK